MNYLNEDTIAALSTAAGKSAIAVIRLSGKQSFQIINKIFKTAAGEGKQIRLGFIENNGKKTDEAICAFFTAPNTYTGENLVEISTHGNPVIIKEVLDLLYKNGARAAEPGEFTYRAFVNGKMDLAEAESVCALITSKTETAAKAALNNVSGKFSKEVRDIKHKLTRFLAHVEASLDYPEDEIPFMTPKQKEEMLNSLILTNQKLLDTYKVSENLQKGMKAAIIGKPNSGKSSLLNAVLGKDRAIVTEIAGTTTDTIEEIIDCRGIPLTIIDTAGIRLHTENSIELLGQERSKEAANKADILIWIFDASAELDKNDLEIAQYLSSGCVNAPIIGVANKSDLPSKINQNDIKNLAKFNTIINISAKSNDGIAKLLEAIAEIAGISDVQNDYLLVNSRHFALLKNAREALMKAKEIVANNKEDEIAALELKNALSAADEILGINTPQDILDTIFKQFCIGK